MAEVWEIYDIDGDGKSGTKEDKAAFNKLSDKDKQAWRTNPLGMTMARDQKSKDKTKKDKTESTGPAWKSLDIDGDGTPGTKADKKAWKGLSEKDRADFRTQLQGGTTGSSEDPIIKAPSWITGGQDMTLSQLSKLPFVWGGQGAEGQKKIQRLGKLLGVSGAEQITSTWNFILGSAVDSQQGVIGAVKNPFIQQLLASARGGGPQPFNNQNIQLTRREDANDILTQTMIDWLDRAPTKQEKDMFFKRLTTLQTKRPNITKGTGTGDTTTISGGVDPVALARKFVLKKLSPDQDLDGTLGVIQSNLKTLAERNGLIISDKEMLGIMKKIAKGASYDSYKAEFNERAAIKYTALADALRNNPDATVYDLATEYIRDMANILEIDPNQITLKDVEKAIAFVGPDGKQRTLAGWEWKQMLREDPRFQYTTTARGEASNMATAFARAFGVSI